MFKKIQNGDGTLNADVMSSKKCRTQSYSSPYNFTIINLFFSKKIPCCLTSSLRYVSTFLYCFCDDEKSRFIIIMFFCQTIQTIMPISKHLLHFFPLIASVNFTIHEKIRNHGNHFYVVVLKFELKLTNIYFIFEFYGCSIV